MIKKEMGMCDYVTAAPGSQTHLQDQPNLGRCRVVACGREMELRSCALRACARIVAGAEHLVRRQALVRSGSLQPILHSIANNKLWCVWEGLQHAYRALRAWCFRQQSNLAKLTEQQINFACALCA